MRKKKGDTGVVTPLRKGEFVYSVGKKRGEGIRRKKRRRRRRKKYKLMKGTRNKVRPLALSDLKAGNLGCMSRGEKQGRGHR